MDSTAVLLLSPSEESGVEDVPVMKGVDTPDVTAEAMLPCPLLREVKTQYHPMHAASEAERRT